MEENTPQLTEQQEKDVAWTTETVDKLPAGRWLYRLLCFFLRKKKLTYQDMFLIVFGLQKRKVGEKKAKEIAIQSMIGLYEYNNEKLPEGIWKNTES